MKKWLIGLILLVLVGFGLLFWLGTKAGNDMPADGEVRIEVKDAL